MAKERVNRGASNEAESTTAARSGRAGGNGARSGKRSKGRGRSLIAILLIGFVLVASTVIWRRTNGITLAQTLAELDRHREQLESERARLAGVIRDESSRYRLLRVVEERGMHVPNDQQVRILPR